MLLSENLTGVQHLGIFVSDAGAARRWYSDLLGFEEQAAPRITLGGERYRLVFLNRDGLVLELIQPPASAGGPRRHGHIDHFALDVLDVESAIAALQHEGAELEGSTPDGWVPFPLWAHGVRYVFLKGPGGEKIELNERLDLDPSRRDDNLGGWSHLGIPTADVERSRRFYADLGFEEALYQEVPLEEGVAAISMMEINGFMLELYRLPGFEADTLAALPDGIIDHIALDVLDADAAYHELKQAGLELLEAVPVELPLWEHGVKYFNVRGPNGEKVEFNQVIRG